MTHVLEYNGMHQLKILIIRFVFVFQYIYIHTPGYAGSFQVDLNVDLEGQTPLRL